MFRAINSPILRSTFLTVYTAFVQCTGRQQCRCIVTKAVCTVKKCSWGWANLSPETCRADFRRLIKRLITKKLLHLVGYLHHCSTVAQTSNSCTVLLGIPKHVSHMHVKIFPLVRSTIRAKIPFFHELISSLLRETGSKNSVVGIVTRLGAARPRNYGSIHTVHKRFYSFPKRPDRI